MNIKFVLIAHLAAMLWAKTAWAAPEPAPDVDTGPEAAPSDTEPAVVSPPPEPEPAGTSEPALEPAPAPAPEPEPEPAPALEPEPEKPKNLPTFTPGVHAFLRGEGRLNPDFDADGGAEHQAAVLERIRGQMLGAWGPVSAFVQFQDARVWGFEGSTTTNEANTDLHQGWMQVGGQKGELSGFVRLGRQEINIGNQRLIGALGWLPGARSFDAMLLHGEAGRFKLDVFGVMLQTPGTVSAPDPVDPTAPPLTANSAGNQLVGLVFGTDIHEAVNTELVALYDRADARDGDLALERSVANTGLRVFGAPVDGLSYDVEGNLQFGTNRGLRHFAWAWAAQLEYIYKKPKVQPGAHAIYEMASGDSCTGDPSMGEACGASASHEFFNFYPTNHGIYGFMDLLGWRNMRDLEVGVMMAVPEILQRLEVKYHFIQLHQPDGRWSNAGGANVGAGWDPTNTARTLGHEIDVYAVIKPWKPLFIQPGCGVFIPTGAGRILGGDDPQHFVWLWLMLTF